MNRYEVNRFLTYLSGELSRRGYPAHVSPHGQEGPALIYYTPKEGPGTLTPLTLKDRPGCIHLAPHINVGNGRNRIMPTHNTGSGVTIPADQLMHYIGTVADLVTLPLETSRASAAPGARVEARSLR